MRSKIPIPLLALAALMTIATTASAEPNARADWGECTAAQEAGDLEQARAHCEAAIQKDPQLAGAWSSLGRLVAQTDPAAARDHFDRALAIDPNYLGALLGRAVLDINVFRNLDSAAIFVRRVLDLHPDHVMALRQLEIIARARGREGVGVPRAGGARSET